MLIEIKLIRQETEVLFSSLQKGDWFESEGRVCMVTDSHTDNGSGWKTNAISIDGTHMEFNMHKKVKPIKDPVFLGRV